MTDASQPAAPPVTYEPRKLAKAVAISAAIALVVLVIAVLPAEYGVDPTGIGRALGFSKISEPGPTIIDTTGQGADTLYAFDLAWQLREETLLERDHFHPASDTEERVTFQFNGTNLTHLSAVLTWQDDDQVGGQATEPDLFELGIQGPQNRKSQSVSAGNDPTGAGRLETFIQWRTTPLPAQNGSSLSLDLASDTSAQGTWTVTVRLYDAKGNTAGDDPGNAWKLVVRARTYAITNLGSFGSDQPVDRITFTLESGRSLEYKFQMQAGANLTYRWTSTGPLTFDSHGDEPGKEEEPVSHNQGVAERDQGNLTAPFTGRHGWWWYNRGQEDVQITLETSGDYVILGVV